MEPIKHFVFTMIMLALAAPGVCQAPGGAAKAKPVSPFAEYAGEWAATFNGKVWLQLRLVLQGEQMSGSLLHSRNIDLNDNGELKSVSEEQATESVINAEVNPDGLLLTIQDADTQENDRYLMRLITPAKDTAELKMIAMQLPPGMAKPKPWRVVKTAAVTR